MDLKTEHFSVNDKILIIMNNDGGKFPGSRSQLGRESCSAVASRSSVPEISHHHGLLNHICINYSDKYSVLKVEHMQCTCNVCRMYCELVKFGSQLTLTHKHFTFHFKIGPIYKIDVKKKDCSRAETTEMSVIFRVI